VNGVFLNISGARIWMLSTVLCYVNDGTIIFLSLVWEFLFEFTIEQFYEIITCRCLVWSRQLVL
jgi:hypothetical protein